MAKVPKSGLREVHIDIGSHNQNPRARKSHASQLAGGGTVLRKFGKLTVERDHAGRIVITDGYLTDWVTFYANGTWRHEGPFRLNKSVTAFIDKLAYLAYIDAHHPNPAPRIGTARPKRRSQITGKKPTKRLVTRRKANRKPGYFPNPMVEKVAKHRSPRKSAIPFPYIVQSSATETGHWSNISAFKSLAEAKQYAKAYSDMKPGLWIRVEKSVN